LETNNLKKPALEKKWQPKTVGETEVAEKSEEKVEKREKKRQ